MKVGSRSCPVPTWLMTKLPAPVGQDMAEPAKQAEQPWVLQGKSGQLVLGDLASWA